MPSVVEGNQVKYLIHGSVAFPEMAAAIRTATGPSHFIYMLNWFCDVDFDLTTGEAKEPGKPAGGNTRKTPAPNTLRELLTGASDRGVMIRAMFWKNPVTRQNIDAVRYLNSRELQITGAGPEWVKMTPPLSNSAAILDDTGDGSLIPLIKGIPILSILGGIPRAFGSSHQKVLCVSGEQGLVCFCGGIDFNPDRVIHPTSNWISVKDPSTPLHDVHCRIVGPAALGLTQTFADRWNCHPEVKKLSASRQQLGTPPTPDKAGEHFVQIGRTFRKGLYSFKPAGEFTGADMILHAIGQAKRFIYTECQYFTGDPAAFGGDARLEKALINALQTIDHLTVVVTHWERSDLPTVNKHRRVFFQDLINAGGDKVRIFSLYPDSKEGSAADFKAGKIRETYVHAKIWVMDDTFAVIGSLNSNRRSWLHDAEVGAGIYEISKDTELHYRLAHKFRTDLWAEHLNMHGPTGEAELADGVASGAHWLRRLPGARVRPYDMSDHGDVPFGIPIFEPLLEAGLTGSVWNGVSDPSH